MEADMQMNIIRTLASAVWQEKSWKVLTLPKLKDTLPGNWHVFPFGLDMVYGPVSRENIFFSLCYMKHKSQH